MTSTEGNIWHMMSIQEMVDSSDKEDIDIIIIF